MPRGRKKIVNNEDEKGVEQASNKVPGRPEPEVIAAGKKVLSKTTKEYFFITPKGVNCKKIIEVTRTPRGRRERVIRVEKNVKMK